VRRIAEGKTDVEIPDVKSRDEVGVLTGAFREMTTRLAANARELERNHSEIEAANESLRSKNEELKCMNEILEQLSITDGLTRLHNHRFFQDYLAKETRRADRTQKPLALILIDIDHFKQWNDRLGHAGGDEILRRVADIMNDLIRNSDLLARYGGEEFALVAPDTDLEGAVQLAEKMRVEVSETRFVLDPPSEHQPVTISIGIAVYHGDRKALFSEADRALYRAKASGRDCVMVAAADDAPDEKPAGSRRKKAGARKKKK
jgi:diguanylate cyclase (GGDEF)-like protein